MKRYLKFLTAIVLASFTMLLAACGNTTLKADGFYWFENASSFPTNFVETLTYDVTVAHVTPSDSTEVKLDGYTLNLDEGVYTTTLKTIAGTNERYEYVTELKLRGSYVTPTETKEFYDTVTTTSEFLKDLTPVKTKKVYTSELSSYAYEYEITYSGGNANCTLVEFIGTASENTSTFAFNKLNEKAYVDNDLMLLYGRLFNYSASYSQTFYTIDMLSKKVHEMTYRAGISNENLDVKSLDNYTINGVAPTEAKVNCVRVGISINDTFSGSSIEAYYATNHQTDRHRLIETYTRITGGLGYLKYSLKSAQVNK